MSLTKELSGREPWKVLLRAEFADQTALQQLIYVSDSQISRPVQHTLRGCNVIGLTGTATRNLTKVIESNGNANGMDSVTKSGRTTTAEVLYRLASASPQGLETPVKTYFMQNDEALQQLAGFAKKESGYNFIINQAAVCDHKSQREIVETLHASDGRPIVFLDLTSDKKCALIHGKTVPLEQLSAEEKKQVRQEGLYYYPAPHTRGTHFDIPTGSKGALLLSPTVNADDRDQAAYRARELGEGHTVECFISQKQHQQIEESTGITPKLKDVLKTNFQQTKKDEGVEDLAAYRLHLQGLLTLAADKAKLALQLETPVAHIGAYSSEEAKETFVATSQQKALLFSIFKRFFVESTNNEAYLEQLDREMRQGGEEPTQESLIRAVKGQIRLANHLKDSLLEAKDQLGPTYQLAINEIEKAEANLQDEKKVLKERWETLSGQFPSSSPAVSTLQGTAEVEAEQEGQQEQQIETESAQELQRRARASATRDILTTPDYQAFEETTPRWGAIRDFGAQGSGLDRILFSVPGVPSEADRYLSHHYAVGNLYIATTSGLNESLKYSVGGGLPDVQIIVLDHPPGQLDPNAKRRLIFASSAEGNMASSSSGSFFFQGNHLNGAVIRPQLNDIGELELIYQASGMGVAGLEKEWNKPHAALKVQLLLGILHIGVSQLTDEQWSTIAHHWKNAMSPEERGELRASLTDRLATTNPRYLAVIESHLWGKS